MFRLICLSIGYFAGCVQTAYYIAKYHAKIDIREHGSGNAGTTNVTRTLGAKVGLITFLIDIAKAILIYVGCSVIFNGSGSFYTYAGEGAANGFLPGLYGGIGMVLGHNFPAQLKFKGGKGVAVTLAVFLSISLKIALSTFSVGIALLFAMHYISLSSIVTSILVALVSFFSAFNNEEKILIAVMAMMVVVRHRQNISRLLSGTENKFTFRKSKKQKE